MTTMTAAQIATVRRRTGDIDNGHPELSDAEIDAIYTDATTGALSLDRTTYFVIRERIGIAVNEVAVGDPSTGLNTSKNQKYDNLMKLLDFWGLETGLTAEQESRGIAEGGLAAPCGELIDCGEGVGVPCL